MVDLSRVRTSRAGQRKLIANYDAQYPARCFPWSCGVAYVLPNAFVRGLVTAIDWLSPPRYERAKFSDYDAALQFCIEGLRAGAHFTTPWTPPTKTQLISVAQ